MKAWSYIRTILPVRLIFFMSISFRKNDSKSFLCCSVRIIPGQGGDLLNVTVRDIKKDTDSLMNYADQNMFGLVMLFSQLRTPWPKLRWRV
jgi:hypothetical protein